VFAAALAVLITEASQSRQHGMSESDFHLHCDSYVSLRCSGNTTRIMRRTLNIILVFTVCKRQVYWNSVLMRLIDDLLALDLIVRFGFSDQRLELTTTFSISTNSE
ncbi:hypothetical protein Tco_0434496, partial [Tanacetum coccineum]